MKNFKSLLAVAISLSLVALSPGIAPYQAAAQMIGAVGTAAQGAGAGAAGAAGVSAAGIKTLPGSAFTGMSLGTPAGLLPALADPSVDPVLFHRGIASPSPLRSPVAAEGGVIALPAEIIAAGVAEYENFRMRPAGRAPAHAIRAGPESPVAKTAGPAAKKGLIGRLSLALPSFGTMSAANAKAGAHEDFQSRLGFFSGRSAGVVAAGLNGVSKRSGLKASKKKGMPDHRTGDGEVDPVNPDVDEIGNPRRRQTPGPDDVSDEFPSRDSDGSGGWPLFSYLAPVMAAGVTAAAAPAAFGISMTAVMMVPLYLGLLVPSLILHEMGHAWAADKLGDPSARLAGRMSFKPKDLLTHIHPIFTLVVPIATLLFTGFLFGGARPVMVNQNNFKRPVRDMARVALAGPGVNFALAGIFGVVHALLGAFGVGGIVSGLVGITVFFNVILGMFNLLPFAPLDGHHVVRHILTNWFKAPGLARRLDGMAQVQVIALIATIVFFSGPILGAVNFVTGLFLAAPALLFGAAGVKTAAAALPAVMALGILGGSGAGFEKSQSVRPPNSMNAELPMAFEKDEVPEPVDLIVRLDGTSQPLGHDIHLGWSEAAAPGGMRLYAAMQQSMKAQLARAGLGEADLKAHGATPIATYKRINTATIRVPASKAAAFRAELEGRGFTVYDNEVREIVRPVEDDPNADPGTIPQAAALSMADTLKLSTADKVHEIARSRWGAPNAVGLLARAAGFIRRAFGAEPVQPKIGVIDTGADTSHPLLKGVSGVKNATSGPNVDDNGHGTWVTSMVLWFAPWLKDVTHYKTFLNGGATLDDILKALTMAGNDGNIVVSNSWGSGDGNPNSPDSQLVRKLAEEGHIMVFAAGNSGYYGANSIGSPAIVHYRDAATGAPRVIAVAATDANKRVTGFSSKGPGSRTTSRGEEWKDYPRKPDAAEQGEKTEAAWPKDLGPDRVDPALGPVRAISGTSMSTPKFAGTIALLAQMFGVTKVGADLDRIVNAVMAALTNELNQSDTAVGNGFNAVQAAYDKLVADGMAPLRVGRAARAFMAFIGL